MNQKPLERRQYDFEVRTERTPAGNVIIGRPIVYRQKTDLGDFAEIIEPGALEQTDLTDVRFLINHNLSMIPLARSRKDNQNSTMQLSVDDGGMVIRVLLDIDNNSDARSLYSAVERGDISGMSFMFGIEKERWEGLNTDYPTRHIEQISTVVEVSAVTLPAYESTEINARGKAALENARAAVDAARQSRQKAVDAALEVEKLKANYLYGGI